MAEKNIKKKKIEYADPKVVFKDCCWVYAECPYCRCTQYDVKLTNNLFSNFVTVAWTSERINGRVRNIIVTECECRACGRIFTW
jgi:hypothetical protein